MEGRDGDESGVRSSGGRQFRYCTPQNVIQEKIKGGSKGRGYLDEGGNGRVDFWGGEVRRGLDADDVYWTSVDVLTVLPCHEGSARWCPPSFRDAARSASSYACIDSMASLLFATVSADAAASSSSPNGGGTSSVASARSGGATAASLSSEAISRATTTGGSGGGRRN